MSGLKDWWMKKWTSFEGAHPKLAKWVYQIFISLYSVWA